MSSYQKRIDIEFAKKVADQMIKDNKGRAYWFDGKAYAISDAIETILAEYKELKDRTIYTEVHYESDGYWDGEPVYDIARCPSCDHCFEEDENDWGVDFCPNCGQALRWNDGF